MTIAVDTEGTATKLATTREEVVDQWVADLESGQIRQARGHLNQTGLAEPDHQETDEGMCCLGVLCEVMVRNNLLEAPHVDGYGLAQYGYERNDRVLPREVIEFMGFAESNPKVRLSEEDKARTVNTVNFKEGVEIAHLNDEEPGFGFPEIARIIRENFK